MDSTKTKILIIDDDPFILDMYVLKLKQGNFEVETASNGKDGLAKIKAWEPDVVLLDIVMPAMDGFDVLRELKKDPPAHPMKTMLLTNLGQKEDVERGE
jgi:CheY-like chemotaxis protein